MTASCAPRAIRILLAEDDATNQLVAQGMLSLAGYTDVTTVPDGAQAVLAAGSGDFDIVLMDCQMPRLDGYEATQRLRAEGHTFPIVALTANATQAERERCMACGMNDFLSKPIDEVRLAEAIARWTGGAPAPATTPDQATTPQPAQAFSREAALDQLSGDEELLAAVLASFREHGPGLLRSAHADLAAGDAVELRRHLHSLAGSAGTLGATALRTLAREMETLAENGRVGEVRTRLPEIEGVMSRFLEEARNW
ncbi:MAG: response regulator [Pseudomonadota bacterium]